MNIGYLRTSTTDQKLDLQRDALAAAGCDRLFEDQISGRTVKRPGLAQALDFARAGDTLVVWRLDRLGRSVRDLLQIVMDLGDRGVGFRSLTESIDTTSAGGRLIFTIFGSIAEFERNLIVERTQAGLDAARRRGAKLGRPKSLSETDLAAARAMLRDDALSVRDVARRLGCSVPTLYRHLPGGRRSMQSAE